MSKYLDIRQNPNQVTLMKKLIFNALKACNGTEAINFSIEAKHYARYTEIILSFPQNRFDTQKSSNPTKFIISSIYSSVINELLQSEKFQIENSDLVPGDPMTRHLTVTYFK